MMNRIQISPAQVRDELSRLMGAALYEGVRRLFAEVERQLFDAASGDDDPARRTASFEALATARSAQDSFYRGFVEQLTGASDGTTSDWHQLIGDRSRALVFEDALDAAKQHCGIEHAQFEARIGQLHSDDPDAVPAGLFTMESISRAFLVQAADLPEPLRNQLVAHWGSQVLDRLAPIYSVLNDYLIQVGVLPGIKRLRDPLADAEPALHVAPPTPAVDTPQHEGPSPEGLVERLAPLVRATIDGDDQYLFRFERDQDWRPEAFAEFVMDRLEPTLPLGNWPARSRDLIRLVGMTFGDVLNDELIDPRHRRQIASLQLAVLLLAARDRHFLSDADHPMRRLINLMALIGSDPDLKPEVQATADMLAPVQEAILDAPERLEMLVDRLRDISRGRPVEPEIVRSSPARDRLAQIEERCRTRVDKILAGHVADMPVREPTRMVLDQVFRPFMVRTMINQGRQSAPWSGIIELIEDTLTLQIDPTIEQSDVDTYRRQAARLFNDTAEDGLRGDEQETLDRFVDYLAEQARVSMEIPAGPAESSSDEQEGETTEEEPGAALADEMAGPEAQEPAIDTGSIASPETSAAVEESSEPSEPDHLPSPVDLDQNEATGTDVTPAADEAPSGPIPRDGLLLASLDFVRAFFDQQALSEEWFEVYTGPGRALRRLKIRDLDTENGVVNFANRTGQAKLSLPVTQVIDDLFEQRTRLVFDNPRFARAIDQLRSQLEEHRDEH